MTTPVAPIEACRVLIRDLETSRLSTRIAGADRTSVTIADGYVPLLVDYTEEDREAKGLRKLEDGLAPRIAVHDTVLDAATDERLLFLTGTSGSGKSTSLRYLALHLAGAISGDARWTLARLERAVARNDVGTIVNERWKGPPRLPLVVDIEGPRSLSQLLAAQGVPGAQVLDGSLDALLIVDGAERMGAQGPTLLEEIVALADARPGMRAIVAGESDVCRAWRIPAAFTQRRIVPLIAAQRAAIRAIVRPLAALRPDTKDDAGEIGDIGLFTLALVSNGPATSAVHVIDHWLDDAARRNAISTEALIERGTARNGSPTTRPGRSIDPETLFFLERPFVQRELVARTLRDASLDAVARMYRADPLKWSGVMERIARRLVLEGQPLEPFLRTLLDGQEDATTYGVIDAARILTQAPPTAVGQAERTTITSLLVSILEQGRLPIALRDEGGRALAALGDPRDLEVLVSIAGGSFTMGSTAHPNSAPPHRVSVGAFRIGRYPVINRSYRQFVEATGRRWNARDGTRADRANAPAVDLSWHDARAYCAWLTERWRATGRIASSEVVRLPTEPEWERASRGDRDGDGLVYPWTGAWQADRANSDEVGLHGTCAVGLFPAGRSPDGCDDMAGQVWEWTTTLWGEDMATPRFVYPYADDGREDLEASGDVRRVLRGGCFLSGREKANCIYRGSLEPAGFWRGNGFRLVVSRV